MGQPVMIHHADGSQTVAYHEALPLIGAEQDVNHLFFHRDGDWRDYAVTVKWNPERKDADFGVGKVGDEDAEVPTEVYEAAMKAVAEFMAMLDARNAQEGFLAAAPRTLADTVKLVRGDWVQDDDGGAVVRRVGDYMVCVSPHSNRSWWALGYNVYDPSSDRFDLERKSLDYVLQAANEWIESR